MSQPNGPEREFEKLSKAITEAVVMSPKVRQIVSDLQNKDEVCMQSFMVLVLRLSTLTETLETETAQGGEDVAPQPKKKAAKRGRKKGRQKQQFIDGERLSKNEIEFQNFLNQDFDDDEWLRENKLIF